MMAPAYQQDKRTSGFTLIEMILALGLSAVLVALLGNALLMGASGAFNSRQKVEQTRLVDGVVDLIRGDVGRVVTYNPQDTSTALALAESTAAFDVDSIDDISALGASSSSSGSSSSSSDDSTSTETVSLRRPLGLYGDLQQLQIDVLREQSQYEVDSEGNIVAPANISGITTVHYSLDDGVEGLGVSGSSTQTTYSRGLVRKEVNRDLLNWADQVGTTQDLIGDPHLIAPEVLGLEFRYFDGTELLDSWDTELTEGALPVAIEMRIWFQQNKLDDRGDVVEERQSLPYVVVIALPSSWNATDPDLVTTTADTSSTDDTSSSSSSTGDDR